MNEDEYYIQMLQQMMYQQQLLGPYGYDMATQFLPQDPDNLGNTNWTQDRIQMAGDPILGELTNSGNPALFEPVREYVETPGRAVQDQWSSAPEKSARAFIWDRLQVHGDYATAVQELKDKMDGGDDHGIVGLPSVGYASVDGTPQSAEETRNQQLQALYYEAKDMMEGVAADPHVDGWADGRGYLESPSEMMQYFDERNLPYPTERYPMPQGDGPLSENAAEYQGLLNRNDDGSLNKLGYGGFDAAWDAAAEAGTPRSGDRDAQKRYALARTMVGKNSDPQRHDEQLGALNEEQRKDVVKTKGGRSLDDHLRRRWNTRTQKRVFDDYRENRAVYTPTGAAGQQRSRDKINAINQQMRKASSSTPFQDAMRRRLAQQSAMGF
jgi:hypothetical protein